VVNASRRNKRYIVATTASAFAVSLVGLGSIRLLGKAKEAQAQRDREAQAQRDREARAKADLEFVDAISVGVNLGHLILKFVEIVARNVS
jgi:F0F1-type ATP synthase assembly protein I